MPRKRSTPDPIRLGESEIQALHELPEISVFCCAYEKIRVLSDLTEVQQKIWDVGTLNCVVETTERFGLICPLLVDGDGRVHYSSYFWAWYNWWLDWLVQIPNEELLAQLGREKARPPGDWLHYRQDRVPLFQGHGS
jgi:hypothetical protein